MSAAVLLQRAQDHVRSQFTRAELPTVEVYGGQFNGEEIDHTSFRCPAVFLAVRGWEPMPHGRWLVGQHVRGMEMSAFVVTKHTQRPARMAQAMLLAERLALALDRWQPDDDANTASNIAPLEDDASCENLYSRAVDKKGLALWVVHWRQALQVLNPQQLWDLLAVQADSLARTTEPAAAPSSTTPITATAGVSFAPVPPKT